MLAARRGPATPCRTELSAVLFPKLFAIFAVVALGYAVGRARWLGDNDPARVLSHAAFYIFIPALLLRTTVRIDLSAMPWSTVLAFFAPVLAMLMAVYLWGRWRRAAQGAAAAAPAVRAISVSFGNSVQLGIPLAAALFGETGLAIHLAIVSLHALVLLTVLTALVELDLARERQRLGHSNAHLLRTLARTARQTIIHPVVLPVLAGLLLNLAGVRLPALADEILVNLGSAVVPLCLVLIGMSLAYYGMRGAALGAVWISALKLLALPALVLGVAHWGFGLAGTPLAVVVMMAALPVGSNALIFAQRYETLEAEATTAIVFSTLAFLVSAPLWLAALRFIG